MTTRRTRSSVAATALALVALVGSACGGGDPGGVGNGSGPAAAAAGPAEPATAPPTSATSATPPAAPAGAGGTGSDVASAIRSLPPASSTPTTIPAGPAPVSLRIADLSVVDAPVLPVGVLDNGEFEVPGAREVGWYRYGARPGPEGSTVLAAHIAYDGVNGVFARLGDLTPGAEIEVVLDDASVVTYEVVAIDTYIKTALPFDDVFRETGDPQLVLISCGGRFDPVAGSYDSNIVAYAVPRA